MRNGSRLPSVNKSNVVRLLRIDDDEWRALVFSLRRAIRDAKLAGGPKSEFVDTMERALASIGGATNAR